MSLLTLPLIFINLGGEMLYILEQRLSAQQLPEEKTQSILRDIIGQLLSNKFEHELFTPQPVYKKRGMKCVFERLAHASIMKLNASSMGKLYDLMVMAFKYQLLHCRHPRDIILLTLNHLDAMDTWCVSSREHEELLQSTKLKILLTYGNLSTAELQEVRLSLLTFLQDIYIRVSIFLRDHVQLSSGRFILLPEGEIVPPFEIPGVVKTFKQGKEVARTMFHIPGKYSIAKNTGSIAVRGDRGIPYGINMYATARALKTETPLTRPVLVTQVTQEQCTTLPANRQTDRADLSGVSVGDEIDVPKEGEQAAKEELNALARLIGIRSEGSGADTFKLTLFDEFGDEPFFDEAAGDFPMNDTRVDLKIMPKKKDESHFNQIMHEFTLSDVLVSDSCQDSEDLLQLMDATVDY